MKVLKKLLIIVFFVLCTVSIVKADSWTTDVYLVNKTNYSFQRNFLFEEWGTVGFHSWWKKTTNKICTSWQKRCFTPRSFHPLISVPIPLTKIPQNYRVKIFSISRKTVRGKSGGYRKAISEVESKDAPYKLKITADYKRRLLFPSFKIKLTPLLDNPNIKASYRSVRIAGKRVKDVEVMLEQVKE